MRTLLIFAGAILACIPDLRAVTFGLPTLDPSTYGFTAHRGEQIVFEDFSVDGAFNRVSWYGLFSSGVEANDQSTAMFDILIFSSALLDDPYITDGGNAVLRVPEESIHRFSGEVTGSSSGVPDPLHGGDTLLWHMDVPELTLSGDYFIAIFAQDQEPGYFLWSAGLPTGDGTTIAGTLTDDDGVTFYSEWDNAWHTTYNIADSYGDTRAFSVAQVPDGYLPRSMVFACLLGLFGISTGRGMIARVRRLMAGRAGGT